MTRFRTIHGLALALSFGLAACAQPSHPHDSMENAPHAHDAGAATHAHDSAMMQRHAAEGKEMATRIAEQVRVMRPRSPAEQHARMGEHVGVVARMLTMMDRHMREMGMTGDGHAHMQHGGGMMSHEQHGEMMAEMAALRAEVEELQSASVADVGRRMGAHLDRLERMLPLMEQCGNHHHDH